MSETIFCTNQDICVCVKCAEYVPELWSGVVGMSGDLPESPSLVLLINDTKLLMPYV